MYMHARPSTSGVGRDCTCPEKTPAPIANVMPIPDLTDPPTAVPTVTPTHNPGAWVVRTSVSMRLLCTHMHLSL